MTTLLDRISAVASDFGVSEIPGHLLPAGFTASPADPEMLALVAIKSYERVVRGREEMVREHQDSRKARGAPGGAGRAAGSAVPGPPGKGGGADIRDLGMGDHPSDIGGHAVQAVYSHPASPKVMYDLGNGLHAEGKPGGKPGAVMKTETGLDAKALAQKGWSRSAPGKSAAAPAKPAAPAKVPVKPQAPGKPASPLAKVASVAARPGGSGKMTDEEYGAHADKLENALNAAAEAKMSTEFTHSPDGGKTWDPERAAVHDEIVRNMMAKAASVPNGGKAIIAGGLGGAGKSRTLALDPDVRAGHYMTINPDDIKEELAKRGMVPELPGMPEASPLERSGLVHEESSHVANLIARQAYAQKKNLVWDITMSSPGSVERRVNDLHNSGYGHVHGMFVHIPLESSVQSARNRHRGGLEKYRAGTSAVGQRYVPASVIRASGRTGGSNANRQTFEQLKPKFDSWDLFDRSSMKDPKLVESGGKKIAAVS